jgi:hypothetical protein
MAGAAVATIYTDCSATGVGDGSVQRPHWRITDALNHARKMRRTDSRRIVIRVAAGVCSGNFEPQSSGQTTRPPELLPLVLNVTNLTLHGTGIMEHAEGYPVAQRPGTATTVVVDAPHFGALDNAVIVIGPTTDGGRADGTVVEGLTIDDAFNSYLGVFISRTQRVMFRDNVVEHVGFGVMSTTDSSGNIIGNVLHDGTPGLFVAAGSQSSPATLYLGGNSITGNYEGLAVLGNSMATEQLDMGANPLAILAYPINPSEREIGNRIEVEISGNDVSNNYVGLRFGILGIMHYPYSRTGNIKASIHNNRFMDNAGFPFAIEQGYVFRSTSTYWTNPDPMDFPDGFFGSLAAPYVTHGPFDGPYSGVVSALVEHNLWSNDNVSPVAPALLTFTYIDAADPTMGAPNASLFAHYPYMRNSRLNLVDEDGILSEPGVIRDDLRPVDPIDGTALNNRTRISR